MHNSLDFGCSWNLIVLGDTLKMPCMFNEVYRETTFCVLVSKPVCDYG